MSEYEKILNSPHRETIDRAIDKNYSPSLIREGLMRDGVDEFSISEITEYIEFYYQEVLNSSMQEQHELFNNLSSSVPVLLANNVQDSTKKVTYQTLLELDILRAEKFTQDLMKGIPVPINLDSFRKLADVKLKVISSLTTFLEYKKAIADARAAQYKSTKIDVDKLGPYLSKLNDQERSIALDLMNLIMDSRMSDVDPTQQFLR